MKKLLLLSGLLLFLVSCHSSPVDSKSFCKDLLCAGKWSTLEGDDLSESWKFSTDGTFEWTTNSGKKRGKWELGGLSSFDGGNGSGSHGTFQLVTTTLRHVLLNWDDSSFNIGSNATDKTLVFVADNKDNPPTFNGCKHIIN